MRRRSDGPDETPSRAVELSWRSRARLSRSWSDGGRRLAACSLRSALRTLTRTTRPRCRLFLQVESHPVEIGEHYGVFPLLTGSRLLHSQSLTSGRRQGCG